MATIELKLREPRWPNFILIERPVVRRQDGINFHEPKVSVGDLNQDQVEWLCKSLVEHCRMKAARQRECAGVES